MEEKIQCIKCGKELLKFEQFLQLIFVIVNNRVMYIYSKVILELINTYLDKNPCHLSASEILVLRPDVVGNLLKEYYPTLDYWGFVTIELCDECYKIYAESVPLL